MTDNNLKNQQELFEEMRLLINWNYKNPNFDCDFAKLSIMQKYTSSEVEQCDKYRMKLRDKLEASYINYKNSNKTTLGGSDSELDLIATIISLGTNECERYIDNPAMILERQKNREYSEGFEYCFPYKSDYKMLTIEYYKTNVQELRDQLVKQGVRNLLKIKQVKLFNK